MNYLSFYRILHADQYWSAASSGWLWTTAVPTLPQTTERISLRRVLVFVEWFLWHLYCGSAVLRWLWAALTDFDYEKLYSKFIWEVDGNDNKCDDDDGGGHDDDYLDDHRCKYAGYFVEGDERIAQMKGKLSQICMPMMIDVICNDNDDDDNDDRCGDNDLFD